MWKIIKTKGTNFQEIIKEIEMKKLHLNELCEYISTLKKDENLIITNKGE